MSKVIVIGAGASGLATAIMLSRNNNEVIILERNNICGKKLLITGSGRCNYFNSDFTTNHFNSNNKALKNNYSIIYMLLEAKYYIVSGVHLDKAKELLKNRKVLIPTKLSLISSNYQMALLDIKEGNYLAAKDKLTVISSKNDKLYVVRKANQLLEEVNEKLNCNLS